jgi:hypothetical protein
MTMTARWHEHPESWDVCFDIQLLSASIELSEDPVDIILQDTHQTAVYRLEMQDRRLQGDGPSVS